jgi:tetratricopeptide (TPR) repeat protein
VSEPSRIEDLRRRIQKDPASIAFAQLAEEHRRAGQHEEAVKVCRAGLAVHPAYHSARVTLGRALLALDWLDEAQHELQAVRVAAPDNLAAVRSLAEIFHRRGELADALTHYQQALSLARSDPELQHLVIDLTRDLAAAAIPEPHALPRVPQPPPSLEKPADATSRPSVGTIALPYESPLPLPSRERPHSTEVVVMDDLERHHALRTIAALEQWLTALNGSGAERHP